MQREKTQPPERTVDPLFGGAHGTRRYGGLGIASPREAAPFLVLIVAAALFAVLVQTQMWTTWTGPGMSMFATVDHQDSRAIRVTVETASDSGLAKLPDGTRGTVDDLKERASSGDLEELARDLLQLSWVRTDDNLTVGPGDQALTVRIELLNVYLEGDHIRERTISQVEVER